ncbi:hypothetical protein JL100_034990 (plasmid) [Skermanella mucosa]|uniref:hypothetical protein n=1 Tax=Skermanella mucosa TaxID=1789672 RepID=UPI00192C8824|nr:hypothetical protein [Skermanella mucosa]UEM25269.1 hypothetical protein JL100_034990 [Skermanella mucosa]
MDQRERGVRLSDLVEPLLRVPEADDGELLDAVNLVAEAIAALGVAVTDGQGRPLPGVSDKVAVLALLQSYRQDLARRGRTEDAVGLGDLARRIGRVA